jgi:quinolinate synthase
MIVQATLPKSYAELSPDELVGRIARRKAELGDALCILGHHYQRDEVVRFADFVGDSLKLSRQAASRRDAKYIVFCGVRFMVESADILSAPDQAVCLPNLRAGCGMVDMAEDSAVASAIEEVSSMSDGKVVPVTYVNSSAATKALTARAGGACCTSSNARNVFDWALRDEARGGAGGKKVFAIPDRHLGRNVAVAMGFSLDRCVVYDPAKPDGGLTREDVRRAAFILWNGQCYVHQLFKPEDVLAARANDAGATVIVHPECPYEVVRLSDAAGSTEQIIQAVSSAATGGKWFVGTEMNLVNRLAKRHPDRSVRLLSNVPARCFQMGRIDLPHLLWVLDNLAEGRIVNRVSVPPEIAADAKVALERMISIKAATELIRPSR